MSLAIGLMLVAFLAVFGAGFAILGRAIGVIRHCTRYVVVCGFVFLIALAIAAMTSVSGVNEVEYRIFGPKERHE